MFQIYWRLINRLGRYYSFFGDFIFIGFWAIFAFLRFWYGNFTGSTASQSESKREEEMWINQCSLLNLQLYNVHFMLLFLFCYVGWWRHLTGATCSGNGMGVARYFWAHVHADWHVDTHLDLHDVWYTYNVHAYINVHVHVYTVMYKVHVHLHAHVDVRYM